MPYDANKGYYCDSSFPADTRPNEAPYTEEEEEVVEAYLRAHVQPLAPLDSLDALERVLADTRGLPTLDEERARLEAEGPEGYIEAVLAEAGEPIVWVSLKAQLEVAEAVARERKNLELRVAELTEALEEIKRIAGANDLNHVSRHIATLANLALNNRAENRRTP